MTPTTTCSLLIALFLGFGALQAHAQTEARPFDIEPRFDLNLVDPTIGEISDYLAEAVSTPENPLNIVVAPEAKDIVLPSMKLRQITFKQLVSFINQIGETEKTNQFMIMDNGGIWYFWAQSKAKKRDAKTMVMHLGKDPDTALNLIDETLRVTNRNYVPSLKFHEPSQSLIATAEEEDLRLIMEVVSQVEKRMETDREVILEEMANVKQAEIQALADENAKLKAHITQLEAKLAALADTVSRN